MNRETIEAEPKLLYGFIQDLVRRHLSGGITVVLQEFERRLREALGTVGLAVYHHGEQHAELLLATGAARTWPERLAHGPGATWQTTPKRTLVAGKVVAIAARVHEAHWSAVGTVVPEGGPHSSWFLLGESAPRALVDLAISTLHTVCRAELSARDRRSSVAAASEVQECLLGQPLPALEGFQLAVRCNPADEIGGDFYDLRPLEDGSLSVTIGDSTGHGLASALMARDIVAGVRVGRRAGLGHRALIENLNDTVAESSPVGRFVSAVLGELTPDGWFRYANAGHEPPIHASSSGVQLCRGGEAVLGLVEGSRYPSRELQLAPGDILVLYSDGITERRSPQGALFGVEGLTAVLREKAGAAAQAVLDEIYRHALVFGDEQPFCDDATVLVVRRLPG
ncbi:MAG: PP2C family protein-serine/threonine phosphatase [Planctomycetota bacterium]